MSEYVDCSPDFDGDYRQGYAFGLEGVGEDWPDFSYERDENYMADWWYRTGILDGYKQYLNDSRSVEGENNNAQ